LHKKGDIMSLFGKSFKTKPEANRELKRLGGASQHDSGLHIRKMSKKLFPRRKKLWHVGTYLEFINFA